MLPKTEQKDAQISVLPERKKASTIASEIYTSLLPLQWGADSHGEEILVHTQNILATTCITIHLVRSYYPSIQRYGGCLYLEHGKALYSAFLPSISCHSFL